MTTNKIVEFPSLHDRKVRGTDVKKGQTLYAIQDEKTKLYFIWAYSDRKQAEFIRYTVHVGDNKNVNKETDIAANWRKSLYDLIPTDRKSE